MKISWPKVPAIAVFLSVFLLFEGLPGPAPAGELELQPVLHQAALQLQCADREHLLEQLYDKYKELPTEYGVAAGGMMLEVLTSPHGESFTVILSQPNGRTCMVASGNGWRVNKYDDTNQGPGA